MPKGVALGTQTNTTAFSALAAREINAGPAYCPGQPRGQQQLGVEVGVSCPVLPCPDRLSVSVSPSIGDSRGGGGGSGSTKPAGLLCKQEPFQL